MRQRGEITVFLSLTLVCILSLFMGLLESARTAGARLYLTMAANSSMASVMSQYNRNLWDMYRLLFLEYESPEAIGHSFDGYLDFYLEQENLYPMKRKSREVTAILNMQDNGGKPLEDGILSYVRYRLPDIAGNLTGITERAKEASRAGDFRTVFKVCRQAGRHTRRLEKARREAEAALEDMERLRIRASEAAADERAGRMGKEIERLQKKIRKFPELAGQYEKELEALSGNSRSAGEDGGREGMEEPLAAQTMDLELAAYQSVEEAGREFLEDCRKAELDLEDGLSRLEEIQGLLEEDGENGEGEEHAGGARLGPDPGAYGYGPYTGNGAGDRGSGKGWRPGPSGGAAGGGPSAAGAAGGGEGVGEKSRCRRYPGRPEKGKSRRRGGVQRVRRTASGERIYTPVF